MTKTLRAALAATFTATALAAGAQVPVYGDAVNLEQAGKALAAALSVPGRS